MSKKMKIAALSLCMTAIATVACFSGLWNSYMKNYCEPIVFYPSENGKGFYAELPPYAPYYTLLGSYSYLTTGDDIDALNGVCSEISDEYRKFRAYDAVNLFDASADGKSSVCYFADGNAVSYLENYITEGNNVACDDRAVRVLVGGSKHNNIAVGDSISVTVYDEKNNSFEIDCTVAGKIEASVPLPADTHFSPSSYYLQQDSLVILPQEVKYALGLEYENRFLVRIVNVEGVSRPDDHEFAGVTELFTERGYPELPKTNYDAMSVSSAYFSFALTKITLLSGALYTGQIYYLVLILAGLACCVAAPLILLRKTKVSLPSVAVASVAFFAVCSVIFAIIRFGCGYGLLSYGSFIIFPLAFDAAFTLTAVCLCFRARGKSKLAEIYSAEEVTYEK